MMGQIEFHCWNSLELQGIKSLLGSDWRQLRGNNTQSLQGDFTLSQVINDQPALRGFTRNIMRLGGGQNNYVNTGSED